VVEHESVQIRLGLGRHGIFAASEELEMVEQADAFEMRLDPRVLRV
jgi:hypothetical protein